MGLSRGSAEDCLRPVTAQIASRAHVSSEKHGWRLRPNGFVLVSSRRLKAAFSRAINEQRRRHGRRKRDERTPLSFGSVLIHSCDYRTSCPADAPRRPDWQRRRRPPWPYDESRSRVLKAAVLVLRVPLRLLVSAAGVAAIFSTSAPQGNEQDAQQGSYQSPQNEKTADAKFGIAGRRQNQKRGQYQGQQAKGSIACHWLHFSQRQRGRAQSQLGYISYTASGSQRAGDLLPGYFRDIPRDETLSARS